MKSEFLNKKHISQSFTKEKGCSQDYFFAVLSSFSQTAVYAFDLWCLQTSFTCI